MNGGVFVQEISLEDAAQIAARIGLPMPFTYAPKRKGDDGAVAVEVDDYEEEDEFDASACA